MVPTTSCLIQGGITMLDPINISSATPEPNSIFPAQPDLSNLISGLTFKYDKKGKKGKKKKDKKKLKHIKKSDLFEELQHTQGQLLHQSYLLGQTQRENDMLRRMSDLAVAANKKRLNTHVIETAFEVLDS